MSCSLEPRRLSGEAFSGVQLDSDAAGGLPLGRAMPEGILRDRAVRDGVRLEQAGLAHKGSAPRQ
jgi:hypothetical protein